MSIRFVSRFSTLVAALSLFLSIPTGLFGQAEESRADTVSHHPSGAHGWEEAWTLELSRGVGTPAVWVDSLLLVASLDRNVHLVAPGEEEARVVWDDNFGGGFEASPLVTDDRIYLPETRRGEELVALNRHTREVAWKSKAGDLVGRPVARGEVVYTVDSDGEAAAFGPNGTRRWFTELDARVVSAPILLDDALVVADSDGALYALDPATGVIREKAHPEAGM
ncbi:MAG: PQQ-binding-like beta-propeller repeat protein, partial [Halobacteriales archaeon]|nr:PQQ-binding-like beta-propeller repeat protein [Halobacteriales archaeon]